MALLKSGTGDDLLLEWTHFLFHLIQIEFQ